MFPNAVNALAVHAPVLVHEGSRYDVSTSVYSISAEPSPLTVPVTVTRLGGTPSVFAMAVAMLVS